MKCPVARRYEKLVKYLIYTGLLTCIVLILVNKRFWVNLTENLGLSAKMISYNSNFFLITQDALFCRKDVYLLLFQETNFPRIADGSIYLCTIIAAVYLQ